MKCHGIRVYALIILWVSDSLKGTGTGRELINKSIEIAKGKYRVLSLEVQNENYGAIQFYMKMGFSIEGIEFSRYPEKENEKVSLYNEV